MENLDRKGLFSAIIVRFPSAITPSEFFDIDNNNPAKLKKINDYLKVLDDDQLDVVENLVKNLAKK